MTAQATKRWYVVHAYSGFEKSVLRALEDRINRAGMKDKFGKILVPVEEVVEMKSGQKHMSERKFFMPARLMRSSSARSTDFSNPE